MKNPKAKIARLRDLKLTLHKDTLVHLTDKQLKDAVGGVLARSDNSACGTSPTFCV